MLLYYTLLFCIFLLFVFAGYYVVLYFKPSILPGLLRPASSDRAAYLPLPTSFADQIRSGFTSRYFDLEAHNAPASGGSSGAGSSTGETREGLDAEGLAQVREIMRSELVDFDRARLLRQERLFARNGVDKWGMPVDAKAIVRL